MLSNRVRNLFSKHDSGPAGTDEGEPCGPQVSFIGESFFLAGGAEGLARARSRPRFARVGPPGEFERELPAADPGEEVALREAREIARLHVDDAAAVDATRRQHLGVYGVLQPLRRVGVEFVVVVHWHPK
jgi:hypothetical protein